MSKTLRDYYLIVKYILNYINYYEILLNWCRIVPEKRLPELFPVWHLLEFLSCVPINTLS